jgi:hypothetical protein
MKASSSAARTCASGKSPLALALLVAAFLISASALWILATVRREKFESAPRASARVVYLHMNGCGWCEKFDPVWADFTARHGAALSKAGVALEDYDSADPQAAPLLKHARGFPTVLGLKGDRVATFDGERKIADLKAFADGLAAAEGFEGGPRRPAGIGSGLAAQTAGAYQSNKVEGAALDDLIKQNSTFAVPDPYAPK